MVRRLAAVAATGLAGPGPAAGLGLRLARAEHAGRLGYLRGQVEAEVRGRLVAAQGARAVAGIVRQPLPQDVEFLHAGPADLEALRVLLQPLARRLAGRLGSAASAGRSTSAPPCGTRCPMAACRPSRGSAPGG